MADDTRPADDDPQVWVADSFGDVNDDDPYAWMLAHLPDQLRSRCCPPDEPWVTSNPQTPADHDHGHTNCLLMQVAADELERLRRAEAG